MEKGIFGTRGFTDKVLKMLNAISAVKHSLGNYHRFEINAGTLVEISKIIPSKNLKTDKQNDGPYLYRFVELAKKIPRTRFDGYVIDKSRDDERVTIDGVIFPEDDITEVKRTLVCRKHPDENDPESFGMRRWWWD